MRRVEVSPTKAGDIMVEGGWMARVPTITVPREDERFREMMKHLARLGMPPARVEPFTLEMCRDLFVGSWVTKLKMSVARYASEYRARFGSLEGFDPEIAQGAFLPGGDRVWKKAANSNLLLADVFKEMRR